MNLILVFFLALADRVFKVLAEKYLASGELVVIIPKLLGLKLLQGGNTGAAFGILSEYTWVLALISAVFSVALLYCLVKKRFKNNWIRFAFILLTAGAIGNLYDRVFIHSVTDYLMFLFVDFPIFNFADCLVNVGVAILVIYLIKEKEDTFFD
ncbi:MAG: signal peptidase II [Oscillospiraceae bacterium]|nr:signal peptidase II [Oscillospiraceae bacterium]